MRTEESRYLTDIDTDSWTIVLRASDTHHFAMPLLNAMQAVTGDGFWQSANQIRRIVRSTEEIRVLTSISKAEAIAALDTLATAGFRVRAEPTIPVRLTTHGRASKALSRSH